MRNKRTARESTRLSARFSPDPAKRLEFIPGQMIVKLEEKALHATVGTLQSGGARLASRVRDAMPESLSGPLDFLRDNAGLKRITPLFTAPKDRKLPGLGEARLAALSSIADSPSEDLAGYTVVEVPAKEVTPALMKRLSQSSAVRFVEPMPARWPSAKKATKPSKSALKPDPMRKLQWALDAIGWSKVDFPSAAVSRKVKVAVLDTGIDETHEDLDGVIASYDHDGTSAIDILGHGTHVAGIIAAVCDNGVGVSGVSRCQLAIWKVFKDKPIDGEFYVDGELYLRALGLLPEQGCSVVNLSLGGTQQSKAEALLFRRLREKNVLAIAAMGNEYEEGNPVEFPAAYQSVMAIGAISAELTRASFSNTGAHIAMVAPGDTILSLVPMKTSKHRPESEYTTWSGTSMAAPHVAGAAAIYWARHAGATAESVEAALRKCAKHLAAMGKKESTYEYGRGLLYLPKLR